MNPFLIKNYLSPQFFCNRAEEVKTLLRNINNQSDTVFFAQRRVGKTALIKHVFYHLKKEKHKTIYIDIYSSQNLKDFTNQLANSIYQAFPENESIGKRFWNSIKLLRPTITLNEMTGSPEMSLDISKPQQIERSIAQLLAFLDKQNTSIIIAIDEFQQIVTYPEKNVEAILRTAIQQLKKVHFIFLGSNKRMMLELFNNAKRPFYAGAKNLYLQKINKDAYRPFIKKHFSNNKISISNKTIDLILELTHQHTYYTQRLCHEIYALDRKKITKEYVYKVLYNTISENEGVYYQYRNLLTRVQWKLLKALAIEEKTQKPYTQKFIKKHDLGSAASIKRSLEALVGKELVYQQIMQDDAYFEIQDKFLMRWLQYKK